MPTYRVPMTGATEYHECTQCKRYREVSTMTGTSCTDAAACRAHIEAVRAATVEAVLADVKIEPWDDGTGIVKGAYSVHPVWAGVDRPDTGGMVVRGMPIARRLERAIRAGSAYVPRGINVDNQGRSYVETEARVLGRMLNADLRRLGF